MAFLSRRLKDEDKMYFVRNEYFKLDSNTTNYKKYEDNILYYSRELELENGNINKAKKFETELIRKHPHSYWTKCILED